MNSIQKILVVGDIILDRYLHCSADRVNPEAPGVVLKVEREECRLGGAGAVAYLCAGLGCDVTLIGTLGDDDEGEALGVLIHGSGIIDHCQRYGATTVKQRMVADGRLLYDRLDWNHDCEITAEQWRARLLAYNDEQFDCVVVADYGRGAATHAVPKLRNQFPSIPIIVDPYRKARWRSRYEGATVVKCNEHETDRPPVGSRLVVTLGAGGMLCYGHHIPAERRHVADVTGCGDTVSAVLAWKLAQGIDLFEACLIANVAAGIQVGRLGVQQIRPDEIEPPGKFCDSVEFAKLARAAGKKVVFTNGCFDVLHAGHVELLKRAKSLGDVLIVGLNSDSSVRRLKGDSRPVYSQEDRAAVIAALACVDCVVVFDGEPGGLIERIRPDVLVKGEDYRGRPITGAEFAGRVELLPIVAGLSSTRVIAGASL